MDYPENHGDKKAFNVWRAFCYLVVHNGPEQWIYKTTSNHVFLKVCKIFWTSMRQAFVCSCCAISFHRARTVDFEYNLQPGISKCKEPRCPCDSLFVWSTLHVFAMWWLSFIEHTCQEQCVQKGTRVRGSEQPSSQWHLSCRGSGLCPCSCITERGSWGWDA